MVAVKICGVTSVSDGLMSAEAGADAIGLNFYPRSSRRVSLEVAHDLVKQLPKNVLTVGVFVDASYDEIAHVQAKVGFRCIQLHGDESPELLERFLPHAYKALRVKGAEVVKEAARFGGEHVLLDAYVPGEPGGTGATFDWRIAAELARTRHVTLAGGLNPENVAQAVAAVKPFCVDVASGVESAPGKKDRAKVRAFVEQAKGLQSARR
jgi:phosphoribosylanthranilate isomerase